MTFLHSLGHKRKLEAALLRQHFLHPITIGSLSSDDDGSTDIISDVLNDLDWLRWDVIADLNYAETVTYAAANGWSIAGIADAQLFVDALFNGASCDIATDQFGFCGSGLVGLNALLGDNYTSSVTSYAWFLSDNESLEDVGYIWGFSDGMRSSIEVGSISYSDNFSSSGSSSDTPITWLLYRDTVSVPEPGTLALLGIGLAAMGLTRRRKKI